MRIRIALTLGALVLAGGALTGGIAMAAQPTTAPPQATTAPSAPPSAQPTRSTRPAPSAVPATSYAKPAPGTARVPKAVPAGPTGDLHLPAIGETR